MNWKTTWDTTFQWTRNNLPKKSKSTSIPTFLTLWSGVSSKALYPPSSTCPTQAGKVVSGVADIQEQFEVFPLWRLFLVLVLLICRVLLLPITVVFAQENAWTLISNNQPTASSVTCCSQLAKLANQSKQLTMSCFFLATFSLLRKSDSWCKKNVCIVTCYQNVAKASWAS